MKKHGNKKQIKQEKRKMKESQLPRFGQPDHTEKQEELESDRIRANCRNASLNYPQQPSHY